MLPFTFYKQRYANVRDIRIFLLNVMTFPPHLTTLLNSEQTEKQRMQKVNDVGKCAAIRGPVH